MKFYLYIITTIFFSSAALSRDGFYCLPSLRATWFQVEKNDDKITITVRNPSGYDFMPQFDGPVSPATIPFQKMQFDDLKDLGEEFTIQWAADKCEFNSTDRTVYCSGPGIKKIESIESFGISTVQITEKYKDESYQKNRYRLTFDKEGNTYFISLDFFSQTCADLK